ncbi:MAG: bifunctional DNA-formamidopyrimidine glycosylase/DNA-(apurinic or apyrimidinic site) lyase [Candidatus Kerfeldbacteria bacterium]|nr:bifunctional DNA-formamidopyrimidine glycosylase/DNA-(apurinic or apyrimidinic site) lyase [Candidatus Kerfeldbacteria bacterium]
MPELPEVETIARELQAVMPASRITALQVGLPKMVKIPLRRFRSRVIGSRIRKVHRRAKLLLIDLSSGQTIVIHLKMAGQLIWRSSAGRFRVGGHPIPGGTDNLPNKYSHVIFVTSRGTLFFNDQRQFGFVKLVPTAILEAWLEDQGYGPEPLSDDFTLTVFETIMRRHRAKRVKPTIMDQTVIAGVGNIYADEALFYARVRPTRRIKTMTPAERRRLWEGIRHVMNLSIRHKGTTADTYRTATGQKGAMMRFLRVYGRTTLPCKRCPGTIKKIVLAGRGTHYCPDCQR